MEYTVSQEIIEKRIFLIRNEKVMIDRDLADLYEVKTKVLNQTIKRNKDRFPKEFMFQLTENEKSELVTNCDRLKKLKHSTSFPYVFTEHGIAMLSSVLNSKKAIQVNILIIKTFVNLRKLIKTHKDILLKIDQLEKKYDNQFKIVFDTLRDLIIPKINTKRKIGFLQKK